MDLSSGYWQVELEPQDKEKTAFSTGSALYQFKEMPMGLTNAFFTVVTDHKPLMNLRKAPVDNDPTGIRSRWILELDVYDYNFQHREGKQHANSDAMSRRPGPETQNKAIQCLISSITLKDGDDNATSGIPEISHTLSVDSEKLKEQQSEDECLSAVISWLAGNAQRLPIGHLKYSSPILRKLWHECPRLTVRHGILCRKVKKSPHTPATFQVVLPAALVSTALSGLHGNTFSGHLSAERTLQTNGTFVIGHT